MIVLAVFIPAIILTNHKTYVLGDDIDIPINWSKDYQERLEDYELVDKKWSSADAAISTVNFNSISSNAFSNTIHSSVSTNSMTDYDIYLATLDEDSAWSLVTNSKLTSYPTGSYSKYKSLLQEVRDENTETITVRVWFWEDPNDETNFNKVTRTKTFAVNSSIACLFEHAFEDIYNDPSQPIINLDDAGMGTWVLRGKNHNDNNTMSSHALGCSIDINPSTGSFYINNSWYGNGYGHKTMTSTLWSMLPETHKKYHVLYDGCPIVEIFKAYGFVWGGDWKSGTDCMHLSYIGDGSNARQIGKRNYLERR